MANRIGVYISSTSQDLAKHRARVKDVVFRLGLYPIIMEEFIPTEKNALQLTYDKVQEAEIFIGIYAYRYGYTPGSDMTFTTSSGEVHAGDFTTSITHWEYLWAKERKMPLLLFVASDKDEYGDPARWLPAAFENEPGSSRLKALKNQIMAQHIVGFFHSPEDLAMHVATGLASITSSGLIKPEIKAIPNDPSFEEIFPNFDQRLINAVLQALELSSTYNISGKTDQPFSRSDPSIICVEPVFSTPPSKLPKYQCDIFVLMPFDESFKSVYTDIIKPLCDGFSLIAKRGDDFFADTYIMEEIWYAINNCRIVIADCTGRNPNVFYELGIAHTLGKRTILITQNVKDVPFDVAGRRFIQYEDKLSGLRKLSEELKAKIQLVLQEIDSDS